MQFFMYESLLLKAISFQLSAISFQDFSYQLSAMIKFLINNIH